MGFSRKLMRAATFAATGVPLAHKRSKKDRIVRASEQQAEALQAMASDRKGGSLADELAKLNELHRNGVLTADELGQAKAKLLNG